MSEGYLAMNLGFMNFIELHSGARWQFIIAGGVYELLQIGYYLDNPSVMLMPVMRMLVLDIMQSAEKSILLLLQL